MTSLTPKEQTRRFWNERYATSTYYYGKSPNRWLISHQSYFTPGMKVLIPADGEGRNGVWCAKQGMIVDAFDLSEVAVKKANQLAKANQVIVHNVVSALDEWIWQDNHYDVVILSFLNVATPNMRTRLFQNTIKTLKPQGYLCLEGYRTEQLRYNTGGPKAIEQLYTLEMLQNAFSSLKIIELTVYDEDIDERTGFKGRSALIGLFAQKL